MRHSCRYRLYPTRPQGERLDAQLGQVCDLYNAVLRQRRDTWRISFAGNAGGVELTDAGRLRVQGVGHIKLKFHRPIAAGAKLCEARVARAARGRWYVTVCINAARNILARGLGPDGALRHQRWGEEARAVV